MLMFQELWFTNQLKLNQHLVKSKLLTLLKTNQKPALKLQKLNLLLNKPRTKMELLILSIILLQHQQWHNQLNRPNHQNRLFLSM